MNTENIPVYYCYCVQCVVLLLCWTINCASEFHTFRKFPQCANLDESVQLNKQCLCFNLKSDKNINNESITIYVKHESSHRIYKLKDNYTFYHPLLTPQSECMCDKNKIDSIEYQHIKMKNNECAELKSANQMCVINQKHGISNDCKGQYTLYSQLYFSINYPDEKYNAVQLLYSERTITLKVSQKIFHKSKETAYSYTTDLTIPHWIPRILLNKDMMLVIKNEQENGAINFDNKWFHYPENCKDFYNGQKVNKKDEYDFMKIGWFQVASSGNIATIPKEYIDQRFTVNVLKCKPLNYSWGFDATNYYNGNNLISITRGEPVKNMELVESNSMGSLVQTKVIDDGTPLTIIASLSPFSFTAVITVLNDSKLLTLNVYRASQGYYEVLIGNIEQHTVIKTLFLKAYLLPLIEKKIFSFEIEHDWVCLKGPKWTEITACVYTKISEDYLVHYYEDLRNNGSTNMTSDPVAYKTGNTILIWVGFVSFIVGIFFGIAIAVLKPWHYCQHHGNSPMFTVMPTWSCKRKADVDNEVQLHNNEAVSPCLPQQT